MCQFWWFVSLCSFAIANQSEEEKSIHYYEENTEFYTGKIHYGVSKEDGPDKVGMHPVTYDKDGNIMIKILAKPNAKKNSIGVTTNVERLGLRIAAPPVDGKANKEMIKYLASILKIKKGAISVVEDNGNLKTVKVASQTILIEELLTKLMDAQHMKPSYIGHPDYMKMDYVDESGID